MIRPTALLVFLMLSASLAGCIEDPIVVEPVPEEDPAIDDTDEVIMLKRRFRNRYRNGQWKYG